MCNCEDHPSCGCHLERDDNPHDGSFFPNYPDLDDDHLSNRRKMRKFRRRFSEVMDAFEDGRF